ncbi:MAG: hypothetical protein EXQ70_10070 [Solirubrobacterales bacterium]|nr:hypothetical protein [Solirubrobacterales bacterium]
MLLPFVQLELPGAIGLADGRYLAAAGGEQSEDRVLIVQTQDAPRRARRLSRRRSRPVEEAEPAKVPVTRVTVAAGERLADRSAADAWLQRVSASPERRTRAVRSATTLINLALSAQRAGSGDPLVQDIGATRALAVRIGYGTGDELADGRFTEARELSRPREGRLDDVDPQSRVAAVLGGRSEVHPAETMLLRARLDLQAGRLPEASAQLRAAVFALRRHPP